MLNMWPPKIVGGPSFLEKPEKTQAKHEKTCNRLSRPLIPVNIYLHFTEL